MKNEILFQRTKRLVATERRIGSAILDCLHEIDRRRAYAELKYDGLFTYCVKELGFTDSQAYQRIQAMRALRELPELKAKIESGTLSVSSVAKVHTHFRNEKKLGNTIEKSEKLELFQAVENRTSREVDAVIAESRGEKVKVKLVLELDEELQALWEQAKNLAAHRSKGLPTEVLKIPTRYWLDRNDPTRKMKGATRKEARRPEIRKPETHRPETSKPGYPAFAPSGALRRAVPWSTRVAGPALTLRRFIPAQLKREIWERDQGKCTRCDSRYSLEFDHILPFACGGKTILENLRLLCRSCNQAGAVKAFGGQRLRNRSAVVAHARKIKD